MRCLGGTTAWITTGLIASLVIGFSPASVAQDAGTATVTQQPQYERPEVKFNSRSNQDGPGMIDLPQPTFAAQIKVAVHGKDGWLQGAQVQNRTKEVMASVKMGWAYVLPAGLEFHEGEVFMVAGGASTMGYFEVPDQGAPARPGVTDFIAFVEQATTTDGTVYNADHDAIATAYKDLVSGKSTAAPNPGSLMAKELEVRLTAKMNAQGIGMIPVAQTDMPTEFVSVKQSADDWLQGARVHNRARNGIRSFKIGWAYVLPSGLEYHTGNLVTLDSPMLPDQAVDVPDQHVAPRADAKEFLYFLDEATQGDGTVWHAKHANVERWHALCCARKNAAGEYVAAAGATGTLDPPVLSPPIKFDVVSFKRAEKPGAGRDLPADGDYIAFRGVTMHQILMFTYEHKGFFTLAKEPGWVNSDLWDFEAKVAPQDIPVFRKMTVTEKRAMMRETLEDSLKLKAHTDLEPHPAYNLVIAKGGPKLTQWKTGDTVTAPGGRVVTGKVLTWFDPVTLVCQDTTIGELVNSLSGSNRVGRVVIDKTGLSGAYNFTVPIPVAPQFQQMAEDEAPSIYAGLKSLGLELVSSKEVLDQIVVDHVERPAEN